MMILFRVQPLGDTTPLPSTRAYVTWYSGIELSVEALSPTPKQIILPCLESSDRYLSSPNHYPSNCCPINFSRRQLILLLLFVLLPSTIRMIWARTYPIATNAVSRTFIWNVRWWYYYSPNFTLYLLLKSHFLISRKTYGHKSPHKTFTCLRRCNIYT